MLSQRHLARMPSNRRVPEARWKSSGTAFDVAGTPISGRYHSIGGVPPGDWSSRGTLLLLLTSLALRQPNMEERRDLKSARILP